MGYWVQGSLFESESDVTVKAKRANQTSGHPKRGVGRLDWSRVTRDPAVAASYGSTTRAASDFRIGLAQAYGNLSIEQRLAIRAAVNPSRRRNAA